MARGGGNGEVELSVGVGSGGGGGAAGAAEPAVQISLGRLILAGMVAGGVQYGWALQLSLLTPYVQTLGLSHALTSFMWLCGPIAGLVVQPCVGLYSDKCTSRWGRRRPFILTGCVLICLAVIIVGFSADIGAALGDSKEECSLYHGPRWHAAIVYVLGFWLLDFSNNTVQGPARALMADLSAQQLFRSILEKLPTGAEQRDCSLRLVQYKVLKELELLNQKDFSHDPELTEDIAFLNEKLSASIQDVSSLDEYMAELKSGRLEWSPVHKSEKFWYENAVKFTDNNYEMLKMLVRLVELGTDSLTLSVTVHDIGEFVRHYPRGKQIIETLGGKQLVMALLQHDDPNVRYNALVSLQKIMVHNWEYLGKQLDSVQSTNAKSTGVKVK